MKSKNRHNSSSNKKSKNICECREFIFIKDRLVCKRCGSPMKSEKKPISSKGANFKSGFFNK